jgi:2-dehydro-3-deoxygalactonokinase
MTRPAALIGVDWGTTSFRAYRIDSAGSVIEGREAPAGILSVRDGDFEGVLTREIGAWLAAEPGLPVIASGMITSRQGWLEVPYCPCPAGSAQIAGALWRHPDRQALHFVPGLSRIGEDGVPDVIRGEETQVLGEVGDRKGRHLLVLPGTHSK